MEPMDYIGLDVHKQKTTYCVKDASGGWHTLKYLPGWPTLSVLESCPTSKSYSWVLLSSCPVSGLIRT